MNTYNIYAETLANDIKNNLHFDTKIEDMYEEVLKASYKLARHIGDNCPMSESKQIVNAFSELIDILPSAFIEMSYWKNIDDCLCECEGWENADCAMISTENISLKHRCNGRYETMAEDIGMLIFSCMDKSEIKEDLELDWDGNQTWQYIHKK